MTAELMASAATAIGVAVAAWQIWLSRRQAVTDFEDQLNREYRALLDQIPLSALLGEDLPEDEYGRALPAFFRYIDLSNEQVFLRVRGRVSRQTWMNWQEGISNNLRKPAFARAWREIAQRAPDSFAELRMLEREDHTTDPRRWSRAVAPMLEQRRRIEEAGNPAAGTHRGTIPRAPEIDAVGSANTTQA